MLKVVDVCKRYGANQVLSYVSFELQVGGLGCPSRSHWCGKIHSVQYHQ